MTDRKLATLGKREKNKIEKERKIVAAARDAFIGSGFENATMSQIAEAAGVAKGTLFLYASSKEELLALVFLQDLKPVVESSLTALPDAPFAERLRNHYQAIIDKNREHLELSRPFLKELAWLRDAKILEFLAGWTGGMAEMVRTAQERGEIRGELVPETLAVLFMDMVLGPLRRWLAGRMDYAALTRQIEDNILVALNGAG